MSERKIRFRKALGGYNKEDVNGFIEEISAKYNNSEFEYQKKIKELQTQVNDLQGKLDAIKEETENELRELREEKENNGKVIAELNEKIERASSENEALLNENVALKAQSEQFASACEKSDMYDKVSEQIGSMIVSANAKAETIVKDAEQKALSDRNDMIDSAASRIRNMNAKYAGSIKERSGSISEELQKIAAELERFSAESQMALEIECQNIKEETNKDHSKALGEE